MSSTNRSEAREKHIADYYVTPVNKIIEFLNEFSKHEVLRDKKFLDPCAGGDDKNLMSYPEALKQFGIEDSNIITLDIREDSPAQYHGNYLEIDCKNLYNIIITNPPFNLARNIIDKALDDVEDGGFVIMLLRLNYFGGKLRQDLWESNMPKYVFVHNRRMSFTEDGKTDSIEYMHCVWQKGYNPEFAQLKVI